MRRLVGQEHLQAAHAGGDDLGNFVAHHLIGRIGDDLVEAVVHHRLRRAPVIFGQRIADAVALELRGEGDDGGGAAGQAGGAAGDEALLVHAAVGAQLLDVAVRIDAAGQHQQAAGVQRLGTVQASRRVLAMRPPRMPTSARNVSAPVTTVPPRITRSKSAMLAPTLVRCVRCGMLPRHAPDSQDDTPDRPANQHPASTARRSRRWRARRSPPRCRPRTSLYSAAAQSGAPRGLHCGMGACFDCVVTVDGRDRPARLPDQGRGRHGRVRRGRAATRPAR